MPPKIPNRKLNTSRIVLLILIFIVAAILFAVLFPRLVLNFGTNDRSTVNVPLIKTKLKSSQDGTEYTVQTLFAVEMDKQTRSKISNNMLYDMLSEISTELDLEKLMSAGGVDYINEYVTDELNTRVSDYTDSKVYVYNLLIGDHIELSGPPPERDNRWRKLFQKVD